MLRHSAAERNDDASTDVDDDSVSLLLRPAQSKVNHESNHSSPARLRTWRESGTSWIQCTPLSWLLSVVCTLLCGVILLLLSSSSAMVGSSLRLPAFFSSSLSPGSVPYSTTLSTFLSALPPTLNYQRPNHTCVLFSHDPAYPPCPLPPTPPPLLPATHIIAAFTVCGTEVQQYALTHLKSWLLQQSANTSYTFYILTDDIKAQSAHFHTVMSHWPRQADIRWLDILSLPPQYQSYLNEFKRCATARVYLPLLLPSHVHRIAYLDVDTLVLGDPRRLWQHFDLFHANRTLLAFAWETSYPDTTPNWYLKQPTPFPFVPPWGLNSGVMLMDVEQVRRWQWHGRNYTEVMVALYEEWRGKLKLGDQDWYNVMLELVRRDTGGLELYVPLSESVNWRVGSGAVGGVEWVGSRSGGGGGGGSGWDDGGVVIMHGNDRRFARGNVWLESLYRAFYYWQGWPTAVSATSF